MSDGSRIPPGGRRPGVEHSTETKRDTASATAVETKAEPKMQSTPEKEVAPVRDHARAVAVPKVATAKKIEPTLYEEHLERLQEVIEEAAQEIAEEVAAVAEAQGLKPEDVTIVWALEITGRADVVCSYCGRPACTYRPVTYRTKNPDVDLLGDSITVFQEAAAKAGVRYGIVVYDEEVLVLREPGKADERKERETTFSRYNAFRDRHEYPDPTNRGWLDQRLAKWTPEDARRPQAGEPADKQALDITTKVLDKDEGKIKALAVAKSCTARPKVSFKGPQAVLKAKGISVASIIVGPQARPGADLFTPTHLAPDGHELREKVGVTVKSAVSKAEKK